MKVLLILLGIVLTAPNLARAQDPLSERSSANAWMYLDHRLALPAHRFMMPEQPEALQATRPSLRRHVSTGALIGGALGTAFALAVVSFADCAGDQCGREAVAGVLGHATAGAVLGGGAGALVYLARR